MLLGLGLSCTPVAGILHATGYGLKLLDDDDVAADGQQIACSGYGLKFR